MTLKTVLHHGGCHCGRVRFEVTAPPRIQALDCNCSICSKSGYLHLIVPASAFSLIKGAESLTTYTFNTGVAQHLFCSTCGIKSFYVPRSNPGGMDINVRCLDPETIESIETLPFDGRNWESNAADLIDLSNDPY
jgi:hypothetical protein